MTEDLFRFDQQVLAAQPLRSLTEEEEKTLTFYKFPATIMQFQNLIWIKKGAIAAYRLVS